MTTIADFPVDSGATTYAEGDFWPSGVTEASDYGNTLAAGARVIDIELSVSDRRLWLADYARVSLNRLLELPARWDGHRAHAITDEAVGGTVATLFELADEVSLAPQFFPLPDGGVQYEWHVGGESVEVEVDAGGEAHVLATDRNGQVVAEGHLGEAELDRHIANIVRAMSFRAMSRSRSVPTA